MTMERPRKHLAAYSFYTALLLVVLFFGVCLASQSTGGAVLLGKGVAIWIAVLGSAVLAASMLHIARKGPAAMQRFIAGAGSIGFFVALFETLSFLLAGLLPLGILFTVPGWVRTLLPPRAFERPGYRMLRPTEWVDDPILAYRHAPGLDIQIKNYPEVEYRLITDSKGFPNLDERLYGGADIVLTGDSFTMGYGVNFEDSWPQQLAKLSGLRILNLANSGWAPYQYRRVLEQYAKPAHPKLIIVGLTNGNDLMTTVYYDFEEFQRGHPHASYAEYAIRSARHVELMPLSAFGRNYLLALLENAGRIGVAPFSIATAQYLTRQGGRQDGWSFSLNDHPLDFRVWAAKSYEGDPPFMPLEKIQKDLSGIRDVAQAAGAKLLFLYLPDPAEVYIPLLGAATDLNRCAQEYRSRYESGEFDPKRYLLIYRRLLGDRADLLADATPYLRDRAAQGERLAWVNDNHPNVLGQRRIAEFVAGQLGYGGSSDSPTPHAGTQRSSESHRHRTHHT